MSRQEKNTIFKNALSVFGTGAAVVYATALIYCINTGNTFAAGLVTFATVAVAIGVYTLFKKELAH